mmetsp:Transcript_19094/g.13673  ORF Transcript_19094/g.13673 Transcript_19094/m.13673 type:complete len:204 (-) Transcript_19094:2222-2833(-)
MIGKTMEIAHRLVLRTTRNSGPNNNNNQNSCSNSNNWNNRRIFSNSSSNNSNSSNNNINNKCFKTKLTCSNNSSSSSSSSSSNSKWQCSMTRLSQIWTLTLLVSSRSRMEYSFAMNLVLRTWSLLLLTRFQESLTRLERSLRITGKALACFISHSIGKTMKSKHFLIQLRRSQMRSTDLLKKQSIIMIQFLFNLLKLKIEPVL